jgi:ABC-type uncharacterized transport system substrate-binding protein
VTVKAELVFGPDHSLSELRYEWLFDPAYSAYAVLGLDRNHDGNITKQDLKDTSIINTQAFSEARYFTFISSDGQEVGFAGASDYVMDFDAGRLTLSFRLHLEKPIPAGHSFDVKIYDPTFFVSLTLTGAEDAVTAVGLPAGCSMKTSRPESLVDAQRAIPDEIFLAMRGNSTYGERYAIETKVVCADHP